MKVVGQPPPSGASRVDQLRWTRKLYRVHLIGIAVVVAFAALTGSRFLWILAAFGVLGWVGGLMSITHSIRRERSRAD